MTERKRIVVKCGVPFESVMPHSEVCMHMRVAGKKMWAVMPHTRYPCIQLLNTDGSPFSFPIGYGEAGVFFDEEKQEYYTYKD